MIISRARRYVFVHMPKTGGTSLALALEAKAAKDDILVGDTPKARARAARQKALTPLGRLWKHSRLEDVRGVLSDAEMCDFLVFTITRNPWDRMVSYYHWLKDQAFDHPAVGMARTLGFAEFVTHPDTAASFRANPTSAYTSLDGADLCDLVIRFEDFAGGVTALEGRLGFRLPELPHVNRSERSADWRAVHTNETRDAVAEMCGEDIERFGYSFDG